MYCTGPGRMATIKMPPLTHHPGNTEIIAAQCYIGAYIVQYWVSNSNRGFSVCVQPYEINDFDYFFLSFFLSPRSDTAMCYCLGYAMRIRPKIVCLFDLIWIIGNIVTLSGTDRAAKTALCVMRVRVSNCAIQFPNGGKFLNVLQLAEWNKKLTFTRRTHELIHTSNRCHPVD